MERAWIAEEDEMAFSPENQRLITEEIERKIREAINPLTRTKRLLRGLKDWGLTALIWTVPLGLLAINVTLGIRVVSDIREEATFRANSATSFKTMDGHLKNLDDGLSRINTRLELRDQSGMNIEIFNRELPAVAASVKSAAALEISIPKDVQDSLQQKLRSADSHEPGYWPAVTQFVSYRSQQSVPDSVRSKIVGANLPRCFGQGRVGALDKDMHPTSVFTWDHCILYLDDPFGENPQNPLSKTRDKVYRRGDVIFKQCLVVYKGGPVSEFIAIALFQDCIFAFTPDRPPSKRGEMFSQFLLNSLPITSLQMPPVKSF